MMMMTDMKNKASEQHIELGKSRCKHDFEDLLKIQEWFDQYEPFDVKEVKLRSLSSGLTTTEGDDINPPLDLKFKCSLMVKIWQKHQLKGEITLNL